MRHPLHGIAIATIIALALVIAVQDTTARYILGVAVVGQCVYLLSTHAKKPPLSLKQRRDMAAYHIDRGLALADNDEERDLLLAWIEARLSVA